MPSLLINREWRKCQPTDIARTYRKILTSPDNCQMGTSSLASPMHNPVANKRKCKQDFGGLESQNCRL
jgi:hypothetical protein